MLYNARPYFDSVALKDDTLLRRETGQSTAGKIEKAQTVLEMTLEIRSQVESLVPPLSDRQALIANGIVELLSFYRANESFLEALDIGQSLR